MPAVRFPDGETVEFAEGTPKAAIDRYYAEKSGGPVQGGGFQNVANVANLATRYLSNRPQQGSTMPTLAGVNVGFAAPGTVETLMRTEQAARQDDLRAKMEQQRMIQQETEAEKARAAAIKLEQLRHKNDLAKADLAFKNDIKLQERKGTTIGNSQTGFKHVYKDPETGERVEVTLPPAPKQPKLITVYDENGVARRVPDVENTVIGNKPETMTEQQKRALVSQRSNFYAGYGRKDASGNIVPISAAEAMQLAQAEVYDTPASQQVVDSGALYPIDSGNSTRPRVITNPDGSQTLENVPIGGTIKPAPQKDPFKYVQSVFGLKWAEADKQTVANAMAEAGFTTQQMESVLGPSVNEGTFWNSTNYTLPAASQPTTQPAASQPQLKTLKDGTKVLVVRQPDGTWKKVAQ